MAPLWVKKYRFLGPVLVAITLTAWPAGAARGQADETSPLISLTFGGGAVIDYVAAIQRAAGKMNIVVAPEANEVRMPPVTLHGVTPAAALDLLDGRSHRQRDRSVKLAVRHMPTYEMQERQTYQVLALVSGRATGSRAHVWTVADLLENGIGAEAVLSAVEMALEVVGSGTEPDVRFHEDTGLLIARGDEGQMEAIDEVVDRLGQTVQERRQDAVEQLQERLKRAEAERDDVIARLAETDAATKQALHEAATFQREMERLEVRIAELGRIVEGKEHELAASRVELRQLRSALESERKRPSVPERERPDD
ncbi:MAG: hypothetical protein ACYS0G_02765 [Planctomycetota bacterium]